MTTIFQKLVEFFFYLSKDWGMAIILLTLLSKLILLPLNLSNKKSLKKQDELAEKLRALELEYKEDREKFEEEKTKLYLENKGLTLGILTMFLQIPIFTSVYRVVVNLPEKGTILLPWVENIGLRDPYYLIPILYLVVNILPMGLGYIPFLKGLGYEKANGKALAMSLVFSLLIISKAPVGLGLYFIASSLIGSFEDLFYKLLELKKKKLSQS